MIKILEILGKKNEEDLSFITDDGVIKYQNRLQANFSSKGKI